MRHTTLLSILALFSLEAFAQPGSLDADFGDNGKVLLPFLDAGHNDQAVTGLVLPDGKILVAGRSSNGDHFNSILIRLNGDGTPDMTFGTQGVAYHDLAAGSEFIRSVALDDQERLVVGGHLYSDAEETNSDMFVARFLADGSLDPSFNSTGIVVRDIHSTPDAEEAYEVLIQPDGKLVLCGFSGPSEEFTEIVIERYLENGSPDPTFAGDGSTLASISGAIGEQLRGAVLGNDGGIYFCGFAYATGESEQSLILGHVDAGGNSPSTFGNANGHSRVPLSGSDLIGRAIATTPDGGFVVAGVQRTTGSTQARFLYSFDATGGVSTSSFYDDPDGADAWNCLLVQNNGSILCGGNVGDGPGFRNWNMERKNADLSDDASFETEDYDEGDGLETCYDLAFFNDGSILGIGTVESSTVSHIALLKYRNDISSGVAENGPNVRFSAFPNPMVDRTTITFEASEESPSSILLLDAHGRVVRTWPAVVTNATTRELDLTGVVPGIYGLRVQNGGRTATLKLLKH